MGETGWIAIGDDDRRRPISWVGGGKQVEHDRHPGAAGSKAEHAAAGSGKVAGPEHGAKGAAGGDRIPGPPQYATLAPGQAGDLLAEPGSAVKLIQQIVGGGVEVQLMSGD